MDARGRLDSDPFSYRVTKDERVLVDRGGRRIAVIAGRQGRRLTAELANASSAQAQQLLLARATGHYRHGNEGRASRP